MDTFFIYLVPPILFLIAWAVMLFLMSRRYGNRPAWLAGILVLLSSVTFALVVFQVFSARLNDQAAYPVKEWHRVNTLGGAVSKLVYRENVGLFATMDDREVKIADALPVCIPDGEIATLYPANTPNAPSVKITSTPRIELPPPPQQPMDQVTFELVYPEALETSATVSYVIYGNNEVWCSEILAQGGLSAGAAFAVAVFAVIYFSVVVFIGSFILATVVAIIALEFYRWRKRAN